MRRDFEAVLDRCLADVARGESLDTCLARYPEHAATLRPLLELAVDLGRVSTPTASPAARAVGRQRMLAALTAHSRKRRAWGLFWLRSIAALRSPAWRPAVLAVLVVLGAALAWALAMSTAALPGDRLYPVKLARQEVQLALTFDPAQEQMLAAQFATARRLDVAAALAQDRSAKVHFDGVLGGIDGDRWTVSSLPVKVTASTRIQGEPYPGALVDVQGDLSGAGYVRALSIAVHPGRTPWAAPTPSPTIAPTFTPTRTPSATPRAATRTATAEPTATLTTTPTATPTPTRTGVPSATASTTPTRTVTPPATPTRVETVPPAGPSPWPTTAEPHPTWQPTDTVEIPEPPRPTHTPRPTPTPRPSQTPRPTDLPSPSATPPPTNTLHPSDTPEPTDTPKPTATPEPTDTPKPTATPKPGDDDRRSCGDRVTAARLGRY